VIQGPPHKKGGFFFEIQVPRIRFPSLRNQRLTVRSVEYIVKKYTDTSLPLHKKLSPHKLRATFATDLCEATGNTLLLTSENMTYASRAMTGIYTEATTKKQSGTRKLSH
jgi:site-specific recombinase XerD